MFTKVNEGIYAVVYGYVLIALVEALIAIGGFALFGVSSPLLLGGIIAVLTFIPLIGPVFVWLPLVLIRVSVNNWVAAIGILIIGLIINVIDMVIKPKIVGDRAQIHPIMVLLGIFGGLRMFGIIGVVVGPVLLALFLTLLSLFAEEISEE